MGLHQSGPRQHSHGNIFSRAQLNGSLQFSNYSERKNQKIGLLTRITCFFDPKSGIWNTLHQ
jgi:hypothetical protein